MYVLYLLKCKQKTYILSLSHHFQASLHWRSKLYSRAWWGTRSGHRYHILRILHPWQDFLLSLLNVTISSCCTLPGIGRNLRRNIVEHLQLKWNKCWHVHYLSVRLLTCNLLVVRENCWGLAEQGVERPSVSSRLSTNSSLSSRFCKSWSGSQAVVQSRQQNFSN